MTERFAITDSTGDIWVGLTWDQAMATIADCRAYCPPEDWIVYREDGAALLADRDDDGSVHWVWVPSVSLEQIRAAIGSDLSDSQAEFIGRQIENIGTTEPWTIAQIARFYRCNIAMRLVDQPEQDEPMMPTFRITLAADESAIMSRAIARDPLASRKAMVAHVVGMIRSDPAILTAVVEQMVDQIKAGV